MKKQGYLTALFFLWCLSAGFAQDKGYMTLTQSASSTTEVYDAAVVKLKAAGVWDFGWNFHALGAMQPTGLISIGVFPDMGTLETRLAKTNEVFQINNLSVPPPAIYEIYNLVNAGMPQTIPAGAIFVHHNPPGMTTEQYDQITAELRAVGALNNPARLFHVAFLDAASHMQVIDIWDSAEHFQAFGATLMPILNKLFGQTPPPPTVYKLHNCFQK